MKSFKIFCFLIVAVCAGIFTARWYYSPCCHKENCAESTQGRALIGGEFLLTDHNGKERDSKEFLGKYRIVYFGYAYCPDVCPLGLGNLTKALSSLPSETREKIQPLFVAVDPQRDTPQAIKEWLKQFDPSFIGFTGAAKKLKSLQKDYKVFVQIQKPVHDQDHYLVDHSSLFYVMDKQGLYIGHFTHNTSPEEMSKHLKAWVK